MTPRQRDSDARTLALIQEALDGDEAAREALFAGAAGRVRTYVEARLGSALRERVEAADVMQETLLSAFAALDQFEDRDTGSFAAWLCRIAENRIANLAEHHGAAKRRPPSELERVSRILDRVATDREGPPTLAAGREGGERLTAALRGLPEDMRTVVLLRHFGEHTIDFIAETTECSPSAVRRLLGRAMRVLGDELAERGSS